MWHWLFFAKWCHWQYLLISIRYQRLVNQWCAIWTYPALLQIPQFVFVFGCTLRAVVILTDLYFHRAAVFAAAVDRDSGTARKWPLYCDNVRLVPRWAGGVTIAQRLYLVHWRWYIPSGFPHSHITFGTHGTSWGGLLSATRPTMQCHVSNFTQHWHNVCQCLA